MLTKLQANSTSLLRTYHGLDVRRLVVDVEQLFSAQGILQCVLQLSQIVKYLGYKTNGRI